MTPRWRSTWERKAYFELANEVMKFTFFESDATEGAESRSKVILRGMNVNSQYPSKNRPAIIASRWLGWPRVSGSDGKNWR